MKALIFDFDGTIADSFSTLLGIFEEITSRPQSLTTKEIKSLRGSSLKQIIKYLKIKKWQIPRFIIKAKREIAIKITDITPFKELPRVLKKLHEDGHHMFILSTNSSENIARFLKINDLDNCFVKIYGDIGLRSKASALKKIMKKQKISSVDCVYIGDEVRDIESAKKAGVTSVAVGWGFNYPHALKQAGPDALAEKPKDLLIILE